MPKILITEACQINYGDERGGVHVDAAEETSVTVDTARALVGAGRALYVNRKEDPSKGGRDTATEHMLAAAAAMRKARVQTSAGKQKEGE